MLLTRAIGERPIVGASLFARMSKPRQIASMQIGITDLLDAKQ